MNNTKKLPKNLKELDTYREAHPCKDGSIESRYGTLKMLFGENTADKIMRELEVSAWKLPKGK